VSPGLVLDAKEAKDPFSVSLLRVTHRGLVEMDPYGRVRTALAYSWTMTSDEKNYTFTIRDAKWSDGVELNAADFAYAIERNFKGATSIPPGLAGIDHLTAWATTEGKSFNEVGIKVLSPKKIKFTLAKPNNLFLANLTQPMAFPMRKDVVETANGQKLEAIQYRSMGPYILLKSDKPNSILLIENSYFYSNRAKFDKWEWRFFSTVAELTQAYDKGEVDIFCPIPQNDLSTYANKKEFKPLAVFAEGDLDKKPDRRIFQKSIYFAKPGIPKLEFKVDGDPF